MDPRVAALEAEVAAAVAQKEGLTGSANKNKRKKLAGKIKKLQESLAALTVGGGSGGGDHGAAPALPAAADGGAAAAATPAAVGGAAAAADGDEAPPVCPAGHTMAVSNFAEGEYGTGWHCDVCQKFGVPTLPRWFCAECVYDRCFRCPGPAAASVGGGGGGGGGAGSGGAGDEEEGTEEEDPDDERPDLLRQIAALEAEQAKVGSAGTDDGGDEATARQAAVAAELAALRETVRDLDRYDELQDEAERLGALRGAERKAAGTRVTEIEKELTRLEEKHRRATEAKLARAARELGTPEAPAGVVFLTMRTAKRRANVVVTDDERWARFQCAESTKLSKGRSTLFWDNSKGGKERKAGLGRAGRILELDKTDASAKVRFEAGGSAWFPVAALSAAPASASGAGQRADGSKDGRKAKQQEQLRRRKASAAAARAKGR